MIFQPKTQPAPLCLDAEKRKKSGTYNCPEVIEQLKNDFHNKCYICEDREPHSINTEHFIPHRGNNTLKFEWNNLFYCCAHCNNTKLAKSEYDNILNCTIEEDAVDTKIKYEIRPFPKEKPVITSQSNEVKVKNTADLLHAVFNGEHTPLKKIESSNLRTKLLKEIKHFQELLEDYDDPNRNAAEKSLCREAIVRQLRKTSSFTAFKLWIVRNIEEFREDFKDYI